MIPTPPPLLSAIRQPAMLFGTDGTVLAANRAAEALAGRSLDGLRPEEVAAVVALRRRDGTPIDQSERALERNLAGEEVAEMPLSLTAADGRTVHIMATGAPVMDGGRIAGALVIWTDVTLLEEAGEALRRSEEEYRLLVEHAPTGICEIDYAVPVFRRVNDAMCEILGYTREELLAMDPGYLMDEESYKRSRERIRKALAGEPIDASVVYRLFARDGREIWAELDVRPTFTDGQLDGAFIVVHDITERRGMEEALRRSEERQAYLLTLSDALRPLADPVEIQEAAARILGEYLGADRVAYFEIAGDEYVVVRDYARSAPSVIGRYPLDSFGLSRLIAYRSGQRTELYDAETDPDLSPSEKANCAAIQIRAGVSVPLVKAGEFVAGLGVHMTVPRAWTREECALVEETAERIWAAIERARAETALRESEAKYRNAVDLSPDAILIHQNGKIVFANPTAAALVGVSEPEALVGRPILDLVHADTRDLVAANIEQDLQGVATPLTAIELLRGDGTTVPVQGRGAEIPFGGRPAVQVVLRDVTSERRAAEALAESEVHLARAQAIAHVGSWNWDIPNDRLSWSDETYRIFGLQPGEIASPRNEDFFAFVHPDDRERLSAAVQDALVDGRYNVEFRFVRRDGGEGYAQSQAAVTFVDDSPVWMEGTVQDITERKRTEEAMAAAQRQLQSIIDNTPAIVYAFDLEERFIVANTSVAELLNSTPEEMMGRRRRDFMPAEDADWHEANDRKAIEAGTALEFEEYSQLDGRSITWLTTKFPLRDKRGRIYAVAGLSTDISERKRAEETLRETRDYLDSLIDYANAPIIVWDPAFRITRFNAAFEHLSGYAADEVIGRDLAVLFPEESREESLEKIQRTITEQWKSVEIPILRPDGGVRIALWNSANIYDRGGTTLLATIAQGQDITERKEAEEELRRYAENLRRSNEDLERFAYVASHDLQEPLRSIVSFSQLLERRYRGQLGQDADEYIDFIVEGGNRMQTLIQDLLAYSRVNTTRQQFSATDTADVLASVERGLDLQLRETGATLTYDSMPVVMADPIQLEQVFSNLVSNAIRFRRPNVPLQIHVGARRLDSFWEFSVADNGIGIEKEYFEKIFVIFQRLHTKDAYPGTGIGLAIVKRIVDRHGGRIWVESVPGEGATFFFTLPAA